MTALDRSVASMPDLCAMCGERRFPWLGGSHNVFHRDLGKTIPACQADPVIPGEQNPYGRWLDRPENYHHQGAA